MLRARWSLLSGSCLVFFSFSVVNAVYFYELDFEPILPFRQCAFDDPKLKSRGRQQLVAEI